MIDQLMMRVNGNSEQVRTVTSLSGSDGRCSSLQFSHTKARIVSISGAYRTNDRSDSFGNRRAQ